MNVIEEIFTYYTGLKDKKSQENVTAMLREIQEEEGFISPDMRIRIADALEIKETVINVILKMCPDLKTADYSHTITLCSGARCGAKDGAEIIAAIKAFLNPDKLGISADKKFRLKTQNCLKQCKTSPNMMIDGQLYTHLTPKSAVAIIKNLT